MYIPNYFAYNINGDFMNLKSIMSKELIIGEEEDSLSDIAKLMQIYDVGFIPIAKAKQIIGVITDRDIVINSVSNNEKESKVADYITRNLISIDIEESIEAAINLMGEERVKRLLINDNGYLAGIVSLADIINTGIDEQLIIDNLKKIWAITQNIDRITPKVNEFKL